MTAAAPATPILDVRGVKKIYEGKDRTVEAVRDLTFSVQAGELASRQLPRVWTEACSNASPSPAPRRPQPGRTRGTTRSRQRTRSGRDDHDGRRLPAHVGGARLRPQRRTPFLPPAARARARLRLPVGAVAAGVAHPHLEEFSARVHESTSVSLLDDGYIVYVPRVEAKRIMRVRINVGTRSPCTPPRWAGSCSPMHRRSGSTPISPPQSSSRPRPAR